MFGFRKYAVVYLLVIALSICTLMVNGEDPLEVDYLESAMKDSSNKLNADHETV